jgi:hypothetical protein
MSLLRIETTPKNQPTRLYLHATEKWGKTSFAAHAPNPVFIITKGEDGLLDLIDSGQLPPTPYYPEAKSWNELLSYIDELIREEHQYKTLVIDTGNGAERLLVDHVLHFEFNDVMNGRDGFNTYGAGSSSCIVHWEKFLDKLNILRKNKMMSIIILAHSKTKDVLNPIGKDYGQVRPEGVEKLWPLTHKWASIIANGAFDIAVDRDGKVDTSKSGKRVLKFSGAASCVAGNRYGLPPQVDCGKTAKDAWEAFKNALIKTKKKPDSPSANGEENDQIANLIDGAKTSEGLGLIWSGLTPDQKRKYETKKNEAKERIAKSVPPVTVPPQEQFFPDESLGGDDPSGDDIPL